MTPLEQARREMALTKHVILNGQKSPTLKPVLVDLSRLVEDIQTPSLKVMTKHLVSIMERLQRHEMDELHASLEIKINQQMLKIMAVDMVRQKGGV